MVISIRGTAPIINNHRLNYYTPKSSGQQGQSINSTQLNSNLTYFKIFVNPWLCMVKRVHDSAIKHIINLYNPPTFEGTRCAPRPSYQ